MSYTVPTTTNSPYQSQAAYTVGILGVILAITSIIISIVWIILWVRARNRDISDPFWTLVYGVTSGDDIFLSDGNDIYMAGNPSAFTLTLAYKSLPITGRLFMINNTASTNMITVVGRDTTIIDDIGGGVVQGRKTAMYIWTSTITITRLM